MIYGAMFDEWDEGTARFKMAATLEALPSGWYLRLASDGGKMLRGEIPLTSTRPINP